MKKRNTRSPEYLKYTKPKNVAEKVYFELKRMLFEYEIVPGQKLQYQDLADKFKVSITPVRDALRMLEEKRFVELRNNKGYYVSEIREKEAQDLIDLRESLEMLAVKRAVEKQTEKNLKTLKLAMDEYEADTENPVTRKRLLLDANYHLAIAKLSLNETLVDMLELVLNRIYLKHKIENLSQERGKISKKAHRKIYNAIVSKKKALAMEVMREHIDASRRNILRFLNEREGRYM